MDTLRILVIAPDPLARAGLAAIFDRQEGCRVVGQAASLKELPADIDLYRPDIGLVDRGVNFELSLEDIEQEILLPLVYLVPVEAGKVLSLPEAPAKAGVESIGRAILSRDANPEVILHACQAVLDGLQVWDPKVERRETSVESRQRSSSSPVEGLSHSRQVNVDPLRSPLDSPVYEPLTPRELEVLGLIAEGLPNKRVAQRLGISEHTVKYHLNTILGKLDAESRTEAVTRAARLGWLTL